MNDGFFIALVFIMGFYFFYKVLELYARRKERILIVEKLSAMDCGKIPEFPLQPQTGSASLKGACLLMGLGIGMLFGYMLVLLALDPTGMGGYNYNEMKSTIVIASILIFGGGGLLTAFFAERKLEKERKNKE